MIPNFISHPFFRFNKSRADGIGIVEVDSFDEVFDGDDVGESSPQPSGTPRTGSSDVLWGLVVVVLILLWLVLDTLLLLELVLVGDRGPLSEPRLVGGVEP